MADGDKGHVGSSNRSQGNRTSNGSRAHEGKEYEVEAKNLTREDRKFLEEHHGDLSKSTLTAKWIHAPEEKEDKAGQTLATRSLEVIRAWVEERGGEPATVPGTEHRNRPSVLIFNFPGYGGQGLQPISWDEWFGVFEDRNLVFVFQQHKADGQQSNFFILDNPEREDA